MPWAGTLALPNFSARTTRTPPARGVRAERLGRRSTARFPGARNAPAIERRFLEEGIQVAMCHPHRGRVPSQSLAIAILPQAANRKGAWLGDLPLPSDLLLRAQGWTDHSDATLLRVSSSSPKGCRIRSGFRGSLAVIPVVNKAGSSFRDIARRRRSPQQIEELANRSVCDRPQISGLFRQVPRHV